MDDQLIYTSPEGEHIGLTAAEFHGSRYEALGYRLADAATEAATDAIDEFEQAWQKLKEKLAGSPADQAARNEPPAALGAQEPTESAHDQSATLDAPASIAEHHEAISTQQAAADYTTPSATPDASSGSTEAANPPMEPMPAEAADPAPSEPNADGSSGPGGNAPADPANA